MKNPRKSSDVATPGPVPAYTPQNVGDPPGSPAYFGEAGAAGSEAAEAAPHVEEMPDAGPGLPPGSPEYWGVDPATHAASRGPDGAELPLPTVGEPPGSPRYFGMGGGVE
jgi:hypothetical protein